MKKILLSLALMIMTAAAIPAIAAADDSPAIATPADTLTPAAGPGFDPLSSLAGILGLRQDIHADRADNANLTGGIRDNRQEIHSNWWDNYNIFRNILGDREQVRDDQALDRSNRTQDNELRRQIHTDRLDLRHDPGNATTYRDEINSSRSEIELNRGDISLNHGDIRDLRNATQVDRTTIRDTRQEDLRLRQADNASWQEVRSNNADIRTDRQEIRNERGGKGSAP